MKQAINILLAYLTCTDPVMVQKWENILASFWHKDDGKVLTGSDASAPGTITLTFTNGDGVEETINIAQYQEPDTFNIAKIQGLQAALDGKVAKVVGKGLSTEDFTTTLKNKLETLQNYVHPATHTIGEVDGLQGLLNDIATDIANLTNALNQASAQQFLIWNDYRWYKKATNVNAYPDAGDELQGRGDGRYESGDWILAEVLRPLPDGQATNQALDINPLISYA